MEQQPAALTGAAADFAEYLWREYSEQEKEKKKGPPPCCNQHGSYDHSIRVELGPALSEIDGVRVSTEVGFRCCHYMKYSRIIFVEFKIYHQCPLGEGYPNGHFRLFDVDEETETPFTKEDVDKFVAKLVETLQKIKYDQLLEEFNVKRGCPILDTKYVSGCDECVVCHELTTSKTRCNHALCLRCVSKLHDTTVSPPCPYCREENVTMKCKCDACNDV